MRGIVFDLDGTLIDSIADVTDAMNRAFAEVGLPAIAAAQVAPAMGHGSLELVRACVREVAADRAEDAFVERLNRVYEDAYEADPAPHTRLYADAGEALPALRDAGLALGVCTNKTTDLSWRVLRAVGLDGVLSAVVGRDSTRHPKPDPRHLLETVSDLGLAPGDVVYVGDNAVDLAVAGAARVRYRHVAWGRPVPGEVRQLERFGDLARETEETRR